MLRLRTESAAQGGVPELDAAAAFLAEHASVSTDVGPTVLTVFRFGDQRLAMFGTIAQSGTPEDTILQELEIEFFSHLMPRQSMLWSRCLWTDGTSLT